MPYELSADEEMQRTLHWYNGWSRAHQKALVAVQQALPWGVYRASRARRRMLAAHERFVRCLVRVKELEPLLVAQAGIGNGCRAAAPDREAEAREEG